MVKTMAKLRMGMAHASTHGARKPPGPRFLVARESTLSVLVSGCFQSPHCYRLSLGYRALNQYLTISSSILQTSGTFRWSGFTLGCDHTKGTFGLILMVINNIIFIVVFYSAVIINLCMKRSKVLQFQRRKEKDLYLFRFLVLKIQI